MNLKGIFFDYILLKATQLSAFAPTEPHSLCTLRVCHKHLGQDQVFFIIIIIYSMFSLRSFFLSPPANVVPPKLAARRAELRGDRQICLLAHIAHAALRVMRVDTEGQQNIAAEPNPMD